MFNQKPQDGTVGKQAFQAGQQAEGKAVADDAVGAGRKSSEDARRARFAQYLGAAEVPKATVAAYFAQMDHISSLLQANKTFQAWQELHTLAAYREIDGGISQELANRIESVWTTNRATMGIDRTNGELRKDIGTANRNADLISDKVMQQQIEYQRKLNDGQRRVRANPAQGGQTPPNGIPGYYPRNQEQAAPSTAPPTISGLEGKLEMTEEYLKSMELKAKIKLNELKQQKLLDQTEVDFGKYVGTLYDTGRLNHVVLAADFYRKVFQEGDYPADMADKVNAALETNRQVESGVEVFRYRVGRGELSEASENLETAFSLNELNPAVLGLERSLKEKVADFNRKLSQARNLIEARDFGSLDELLAQIKVMAPDFDASKPRAIVNAVKLESKMRMGKAKLAAQQGDLKTAMAEFQAAAEAWPGNPDLQTNAGTFFDTQDVKSQSLAEFDRLVSDENYRAIFDKQLAFAPAIKGDPKREEELKKALLAIKDAEVASEKANVLMLAGDYMGAWEAIELASSHLPDDKKLNKLRADLSSRSAEFVSAINKARDAEGRNEVGFSLTWYVNAQRQYPASEIANQGIERLSKKLLQPGA